MARIMHPNMVEIWKTNDVQACTDEVIKYLRENYPDKVYPRMSFNIDSEGVHFYIYDNGNR